MSQDDSAPLRRRITAPRSPTPAAPAARRPANADSASGDVGAIYVRTLIRAQLRVAIACCLGFVVTMTTAAVLIATTPALHETYVFGVPWSWALQAYGMYPLIAFFAAIFVRAASRNESRYRLLRESG